MKKISAVLLVLVLVGGVAFADIAGSYTTQFGYNLDGGAWGFVNDAAADIAMEVVIHEAVGAAKGEGDIYAEINASASLTWDGTAVLVPTFAIDSVNIVSADWTVGIMSALDATNYATSVIDIDENDEYADLLITSYLAKVAGVNLTTGGYTASLGLVGDTTDAKYSLYGSLEVPAIELGDGLTANLGFAGLLTDDTTDGTGVSASVKAAYASEDYSASVAADLVYAGAFEADVALNAAFGPAVVDVYYATTESYATDGDSGVTDLLSAKVAIAAAPMTVTLTGIDLIGVQTLSAGVDYVATDMVSVNVNGGYVVDDETWSVGGGLTYTAADYTATIDALYDGGLDLNASVSKIGRAHV